MQASPIFPLIQIYVIATVAYLIIQLTMATANWLTQKQQEAGHLQSLKRLYFQCKMPRISVVIPTYNEDPAVLERVFLHAARCLRIQGLELIIVDDCSPNIDELEAIYRQYEQQYGEDQLRILRMNTNRGKRHAMNTGFEVASGEIIITADSDTLLYPSGIIRLVAPLIADPHLGAVTGDVRVENWKQSWLTHLIALRYWISFHVERGSQSFTGSMMCCSGPFTAYRSEIIHKVRHSLVTQTFMGQPCTYGDDRHLTWLVLKEGYTTRIQEGAIARTWAPTSIRGYIPQQVRWTKSFIREIFWVLPGYYHISLYSLLDTIYQPLLSFFFMFAMINVFFVFFETWDPLILVGEVLILLMMASLRGFYGLVRTRWPGFLRAPLYGLVHIFVILPLRWKALFSLKDISWGTRTSGERSGFSEFRKWSYSFFGTVTLLGLTISLLVPGHGMRLYSQQLAATNAVSGSQTAMIPVAGVPLPVGPGTLHLFADHVSALLAHFAEMMAYWWVSGLTVAAIFIPIFLVLGLRRLLSQRPPGPPPHFAEHDDPLEAHSNPS